MKTTSSHLPKARGFTLMELLVVISIIGILAGIMIAALPGINAKIERDRTRTFLMEIGNGLDRYKADHAIYPMSPKEGGSSTNRDSDGIAGSAILYQQLSGDGNGDGKVDPEVTVYLPNSNYETSRASKNPRSAASGGGHSLIDPSGSIIRYLCEKPGTKEKKTFNPTYDLWSILGASNEPAKWVTNWTAN